MIRHFSAALVLALIATNAHAECLTYTARVRVEGTIERKTFPGPPQFESVAAGDTPETVWLLKLDRPVCVSADPKDASGINAAVRSVSEIQLLLTAAQYTAYAKRVGGHAVLTGKFFGAVTAHHRTPVVLDQVRFEP